MVPMSSDTNWCRISSGSGALLGYLSNHVLSRCGAESVHPDVLPKFNKCISEVTRQPKRKSDFSVQARWIVAPFRSRVEWLASEVRRAAGICSELLIDSSAVSHAISNQSTVLLQVVQKGLTKVMKHVDATRLKIGVLRITVCRETAKGHGGMLDSGSQTTACATLDARLPLD
jgi:hypothetical protein